MPVIFLGFTDRMDYTFVPQCAQNFASLFSKGSPQNEQKFWCGALLSSTGLAAVTSL
jgi:hypothetical protein